MVSIPVAAVLAFWLLKTCRLSWRARCSQVVLPVVVVLLLAAAWMGFYNFRVTGNPLVLPFQVHEATYGMVPQFLWQPLQAKPVYNHSLMEDLHAGWFLGLYVSQHSFSGWLQMASEKISMLWLFFVGILFLPFMVALPQMWRRWSVKFALGVWACLLLALLTETWTFPHYAAPATSLAILLIVESLRQARLIHWRGRPVGRILVRAVLPLLLVSSLSSFALSQYLKPSGWYQDRARFLQELEKMPGRQLVMVRYRPEHSPHKQWIYNKADIDAAKVVWAWEMGPAEG